MIDPPPADPGVCGVGAAGIGGGGAVNDRTWDQPLESTLFAKLTRQKYVVLYVRGAVSVYELPSDASTVGATTSGPVKSASEATWSAYVSASGTAVQERVGVRESIVAPFAGETRPGPSGWATWKLRASDHWLLSVLLSQRTRQYDVLPYPSCDARVYEVPLPAVRVTSAISAPVKSAFGETCTV
jgi:hypothetical protein